MPKQRKASDYLYKKKTYIYLSAINASKLVSKVQLLAFASMQHNSKTLNNK